ncbi:hypothetical protein [Actinomadura sediminis]|uniref:Uncharacterized protein n=1 Tax=Actinomadura sediminis TaxID=1038904 RepID=A0ABW3EKP1_9ACTN
MNVLEKDVARRSPLRHANINCLGHYNFRAPTPGGGACGRCVTRTRPG